MSFGRTKLLLTFALAGYLIGAVAYVAFDWIFVNAAVGIQPVPILAILTAPWFLSGIAGALLAMAILYLSAKFTSD